MCVCVCYLAGASKAGVVLWCPLRPMCMMFSLKKACMRVLSQLSWVTDEYEVIKLRLLNHLAAGAELTAVGNVNLENEDID